MKRALGLALAVAALAPASAGAAVPGPKVVDFESDPALSGASFSAECGTALQPAGGSDGGRYLLANCGPAQVDFPAGESMAATFVRVPGPGTITLIAEDANFNPVGRRSVAPATDVWTPVSVNTDDGTASMRFLEIDYQPSNISAPSNFDIDEVGFSPTAQPDVDITGGPAGTVASSDATFSFAGNQPKMTFFCKLDGQASEPCDSPKSYSGLSSGDHTFTVFGRDRWGNTDVTPAGRTWRVEPAAPPPPSDRDFDGIPDASDNCPDNANASQGDADKDGVGDACELLPSGNTPIVAGKDATVRLVSGEVFVKLPPGASGSAFTSGLRVPFQSSGFLPLKGVAAVPMGSTLDTRKGEVALTAAVNGQPARSRKQLRREARFRAGIFAIRQARKKRKAKRSKRIPARAELASPPNAERPCRASGPPKGVAVRSLSMTAKVVFRAVGGAATAIQAKGTSTFITTDRCDGTVTEVGRGRVAVVANRSGKRAVVKAGRAYIVRARLFQARKGRKN
jgi:hypothetical protein